MKLHSLTRALLLIASTLVPAAGFAQAYPTKPVTLVVPFPAGGSADATGRLVAEVLGKALGQTVQVENRAGAAGLPGAQHVAKSAPDGYTLILSQPTVFSIFPALKSNVGVDPVADFSKIGFVGRGPYAIAAGANSPYKTIADVVKDAKDGRAVTVGTAGIGSTPHLIAELIMQSAGMKLTHVPYQGGAPAVNGLLSGEVNMISAFISEVLPHKDKGMRILAVTGPQRFGPASEVPTLIEQGIDVDISTWFAVYGPKGMPDDIVKTLNDALNSGLAQPETVERFARVNLVVQPMTPSETAADQQKQIAIYERLKGVVALD